MVKLNVVFYYLKTPYNGKNPTVGAHLDKMGELGIFITSQDREFLGADWKSDINEVRSILLDSNEFKDFKKKKIHRKFLFLKNCINKRNILSFIFFVLIICVITYIMWMLDIYYNTDKFTSFFFNAGFSGFMIYIIIFFTRYR